MATEPTDTAPTHGAITLIVDFSNGVQKIFTNLPSEPPPDPILEREGIGATDVLEMAGARAPGLSYTFERSFVDRGGGERGAITAVDGVEAKAPDQQWQVWVNQTAADALRRVIPETVGKRVGWPEVEPGDVVLLKLVEMA
jgi:hypothetical protein